MESKIRILKIGSIKSLIHLKTACWITHLAEKECFVHCILQFFLFLVPLNTHFTLYLMFFGGRSLVILPYVCTKLLDGCTVYFDLFCWKILLISVCLGYVISFIGVSFWKSSYSVTWCVRSWCVLLVASSILSWLDNLLLEGYLALSLGI